MFIELTPLVQRSPQRINVDTIRQIEPVKSSQVNFPRINFAEFSTTLDVYEKYEEVKTLISHAHLVPQAAEQSDSAPATQSEVAYRNPDCSGASPTAEPLSPSPAKWNT